MWCGVLVWCGVVRCGVVRWGVVWCGVLGTQAVNKKLLAVFPHW